MTTLNFKLPVLLGKEPFTLLTENGPNPKFPIIGYGSPLEASGSTAILQFDAEGVPEDRAYYSWMHLKQAPLTVSGYMIFHAYKDAEKYEVQTQFVGEHILKDTLIGLEKRLREILAVVRVEVQTELGTLELPTEPVLEQIAEEHK